MKVRICDGRRYISLFLALSILFCAILFCLAAMGEKFSIYSAKSNNNIFADADLPVTVVIDPGHGGEDGGAVGADGVTEKDLNLSIAFIVCDILKQNGINAVMTRTEDVLLYDKNSDHYGQKKIQDLSTRRRIAESYENAVLVSIHMNAFPDDRYSGLQVYYSKNAPDSKIIAERIQDLTRELLMPENNRRIKASNGSIYLLDRLSCPAVLIECGFLSNDRECAMLADKDYQKKLSLCICSVIMEYIGDGT